jgi:hypothetical protein
MILNNLGLERSNGTSKKLMTFVYVQSILWSILWHAPRGPFQKHYVWFGFRPKNNIITIIQAKPNITKITMQNVL